MTPEETALTLEKMRTLYPIPRHVENRDGYLAEYGKSLKSYPFQEATKAVDWLFQNRPEKTWPTPSEFREAAKATKAIERKPTGRWLSRDEKEKRAKNYANGWLNTIDGQDLVEREPDLTDWVFAWIVKTNMDNEPEQVKLPTESTFKILRCDLAEFEEWLAGESDKQKAVFAKARSNKLARLQREGVYM